MLIRFRNTDKVLHRVGCLYVCPCNDQTGLFTDLNLSNPADQQMSQPYYLIVEQQMDFFRFHKVIRSEREKGAMLLRFRTTDKVSICGQGQRSYYGLHDKDIVKVMKI